MVDVGTGLLALGAGLGIGLSALGAGLAEKSIGAAAVGAMVEDEKHFAKALLLTVIPETLIIFGLVVSIMLIQLVQ